jgi:adenylate kinase
MSKIIVLIGAPGVGKGTQARLLQERRSIPQISTGDMFREMKNSNTDLAKEVQSTMAAGKLISDELTLKVVKERTTRDDCKMDYILDGYPRTQVQAEQLEIIAQEQNKSIVAIEVDLPKQELIKRLTGRRSCKSCGEIFNIYFKPPTSCLRSGCDLDKNLEHRSDDNLDSVVVRLATYDELTKPLLEYYQISRRHHKVDGNGSLEVIYSSISELI